MAPPTISPELGFRLAAFADGEGCFSIRRKNVGKPIHGWSCAFFVNLRADDRAILDRFCEGTGLGSVRLFRWTDASNPNPQARWQVSRKAEVMRLTEIFDEYPLWSKKARDYAIWREAAIFWFTTGGDGTDWSPMAQWFADLKTTRAFSLNLVKEVV